MNNIYTTLPGPVYRPVSNNPFLTCGVYNVTPPTIADGLMSALQVDVNGNLCVNVKVGGGGGTIGTVNEGNKGTIAQSWYVQLTDGSAALGTSGNPLRIDPTGTTLQPTTVVSSDKVDAANSSTTPLAANATFTGSFESAIGFTSLVLSVDTDQISAATSTTGVVVQWSEDGVNVGDSDVFSITAVDILPVGQTWIVPAKRQYYRVVYTNGATLQGTFRLQTVMKVVAPVGVNLDVNDSVETTMHAQLTRAIVSAKTPSGTYTNILGDSNGNLFTVNASTDNAALATWSSATAGNTVATPINNIQTYNNLTMQFTTSAAGTITGGVVSFEGSIDGANWVAVTGVQANGTTSSTLILSANTTVLYQFNIAAYAYFRVRLSTVITGTGTLTIGYGASGAASNNGTTLLGGVTIANAPGVGTPGTAVPGSAIYEGVRAATALPTAVTNGQVVGLMADKYGRQVSVLNTPRDLVGTAVLSNNSAASAASLIAAGATGVFTDIITFIATNRSATATVVTLTDGTVSYTFALAANGGIVINFPTPLPATTAATAWTVGNSAPVACDYVVVYANNK